MDDRYYLTTGFLSKHLSDEGAPPGGWNESNSGLGLKTPGGILGGIYRNSLGRTSVYGGKEWATDKMRLGPLELQAALTAGLITGYPQKPVMPFAMPGILATLGDHQLATGFVPGIRGASVPTIALQYRRSF